MVAGMLKDPASQNLWPVGIVVLAVPALAASAIGTFVGSLVVRLTEAKTGTNTAPDQALSSRVRFL